MRPVGRAKQGLTQKGSGRQGHEKWTLGVPQRRSLADRFRPADRLGLSCASAALIRHILVTMRSAPRGRDRRRSLAGRRGRGAPSKRGSPQSARMPHLGHRPPPQITGSSTATQSRHVGPSVTIQKGNGAAITRLAWGLRNRRGGCSSRRGTRGILARGNGALGGRRIDSGTCAPLSAEEVVDPFGSRKGGDNPIRVACPVRRHASAGLSSSDRVGKRTRAVDAMP